MKKKLLILSIGLAVGSFNSACKKKIYGCTDSNASNYSSIATIDDGSCFYPSDNVYVGLGNANWQLSGFIYTAEFIVPELTQDVFNVGAILVYAQTDVDQWDMLPLTFPQSSSYSTTIEVVFKVGKVFLNWFDSDLTTPAYPFLDTFKIVIIKNKGQIKPDHEYFDALSKKR